MIQSIRTDEYNSFQIHHPGGFEDVRDTHKIDLERFVRIAVASPNVSGVCHSVNYRLYPLASDCSDQIEWLQDVSLDDANIFKLKYRRKGIKLRTDIQDSYLLSSLELTPCNLSSDWTRPRH